MIKISRKEQQVLRNLKNVMVAEQTEVITQEMLENVDPGQNIVNSLLDKNVFLVEKDFTSEEEKITITKDQLQVEDDDPEVEQAWENFRQVQDNKTPTKEYVPNRAAETASKKLEKILFEKGRLTHMVNSDNVHIWVTEDKVQYWQDRKFKEVSPAAVPAGL